MTRYHAELAACALSLVVLTCPANLGVDGDFAPLLQFVSSVGDDNKLIVWRTHDWQIEEEVRLAAFGAMLAKQRL